MNDGITKTKGTKPPFITAYHTLSWEYRQCFHTRNTNIFAIIFATANSIAREVGYVDYGTRVTATHSQVFYGSLASSLAAPRIR